MGKYGVWTGECGVLGVQVASRHDHEEVRNKGTNKTAPAVTKKARMQDLKTTMGVLQTVVCMRKILRVPGFRREGNARWTSFCVSDDAIFPFRENSRPVGVPF
jgi:hypothetical protein